MSVISITHKSGQWTPADAALLDAVMDDDIPAAREAFRKGGKTMAYHTHVDGLGEGPFWTLLAGTQPALDGEDFLISLPMLHLFLEHGANLNHHHQDQDATPLLALCESGAGNAVEAVKMLLAAGAVPQPSLILEGTRFPSDSLAVGLLGDVLLPPDLPPIWDVIWPRLTAQDQHAVLAGGPFLGFGVKILNESQHRRAEWLLDHGASLDLSFTHEGVDCRPSEHLHTTSLARLRAHVPVSHRAETPSVSSSRRRLTP